jgi:uncharacterized RDD family membrane protein YckC
MNEEPVVGRRIGAGLIDVLLMTALFFALAASMGELESGDGSFQVELTGGPFLLFLAIQLGYYFVLETLYGKTLGKALLGLRVVAEDGSKATGGAVAARTILRLIDGLPGLYLLGIVVIAASKKDQRIGDMAGRTRVVAG